MKHHNGIEVRHEAGGYYPTVNIKVHMPYNIDSLLPLDLGQVSDDGGKTFTDVKSDPEFTEEWIEKHVSEASRNTSWEFACEDNFQAAVDLAKDTFGHHVEVYTAGRSGGWLYVINLGDVEEWSDEEIARWEEYAEAVRRIVKDVPRAYLWQVHNLEFEEWTSRIKELRGDVPEDFPVEILLPNDPTASDLVTCSECHRSWDDAVSTGMTPVPSGRCPFESYHPEPEPTEFATVDELPTIDGEVVVNLPDGWTLRSGAEEDERFISGEYVRLVQPDGKEYVYWDSDEWKTEPVEVMGAIINAAAGLRLQRPKKEDRE